MALSENARKALENAMPQSREGAKDGAEVADAIDAAMARSVEAEALTALGATTNLVGVDGTGSNAAPLVETEARLDAIEAKIDAIIAALKA